MAQTSTPETRQAVGARRKTDIGSIINGIGFGIACPPLQARPATLWLATLGAARFPQLRHPPRESGHLTCLRSTDPHEQPRLALCSHTSGPIGQVSRLVAILSRMPNG